MLCPGGGTHGGSYGRDHGRDPKPKFISALSRPVSGVHLPLPSSGGHCTESSAHFAADKVSATGPGGTGRAGPFLAFSWCLVILAVLGVLSLYTHHFIPPCCHVTSSLCESVSRCPSSYKDPGWAPPNAVRPQLNLMQSLSFQVRSQSQFLGRCDFWGDALYPTVLSLSQCLKSVSYGCCYCYFHW